LESFLKILEVIGVKISRSGSSWRGVQSTISHLMMFSRAVVPLSRTRKLRPDKRFLSWPDMPKRDISALAGYINPPKIDLELLQSFVNANRVSGRSFAGSIDNFCGLDMKRAMAIKKMNALVQATIDEMKAITYVSNLNPKA